MACREGAHLNSGESLEACARHVLALDAGATSRVVGFGINCTPPQHVEGALSVIQRVFASETGGKEGREENRLLIAYPNSGEVWEGKQWLPGTGPCPTPRDFASLAARWVAAGATIVGGCCRTTPETIQAVRAHLLPVEEEEEQGVKR
jgi:homocysteine S-methyltransferase